jgi:hypothetical protein
MRIPFILFFLLPILVLLSACQKSGKNSGLSQNYNIENESEFADYWFSGVAEISSYELQQVRYGEIRQGNAVFVFVTEPFSEAKQVKLDYPENMGEDNVAVMKLNAIRKFNTGIYDYSMMTSVFTPIALEQHPRTFKTTTSIQEWCGHTFTQFNLKGNQYEIKGFSYFESEGDISKKVSAELLEDEIWTRIRIQPNSVPTGTLEVIPSSFYVRLQHTPIIPARATIKKVQREATTEYTIEYLHQNRTLTISVEQVFPYKILGWTEDNGDGLITKATLKKTILSPYWQQNSNQYEHMRAELELVHQD